MKQKEFEIIQLSHGFNTAAENMSYDNELLHRLMPNQRIERFYIWQQPGITYSYKQTCPKQMSKVDSSSRLTGGGIVFHTPGDIVFSLVGWNNDPQYGQKMKQKLTVLSDRITTALVHVGVEIDSKASKISLDLNFCATYPTPFEVAVNNEKILGLTIRQFKSKWLIQGVIHTKPTHSDFLSINKCLITGVINEQALLSVLTQKH
jgi:lipoate-protein ligase A